MKRFGIRMDGNEIFIENLLKDYLKNITGFFRYVEIGAAGCITLRAIYDIVKENIKDDRYEIDGLDIINGWSLDMEETKKLFKNDELELYINGSSESTVWPRQKVRLHLESNPRQWIANLLDESVDISLIDGCHGAPCVIKDFLAIEPKIKHGGIVIFHDCGELEQGTDFQVHCGEPINVRKALIDLGLLDNRKNGWELVKENQGTRIFGGWGNNTIVFKKCN